MFDVRCDSIPHNIAHCTLNIRHHTSFRIVLFGDVHLYRLRLAPWHLLSKRILGQTNLWLNRRSHFDPSLLQSMVERIIDIDPHQVLCPGDLTTTATHQEFILACGALADIAQRYPLFIVPGNHDRYTFTASRTKRFEQYFGQHTADRYPYARQLAEGLHLIAIDSCKPNLLLDRGRIGDSQRTDLMRRLGEIPPDHHVLLLCHYTPGVPGAIRETWSHRLIDERALVQSLAQSGRKILFVHGHVHRPWCWRLEDATHVVAINAGSPTRTSKTMPRGQGFWQLDFELARSPCWTLTHHRLHAPGQWLATPIAWPTQPGQLSDIP